MEAPREREVFRSAVVIMAEKEYAKAAKKEERLRLEQVLDGIFDGRLVPVAVRAAKQNAFLEVCFENIHSGRYVRLL